MDDVVYVFNTVYSIALDSYHRTLVMKYVRGNATVDQHFKTTQPNIPEKNRTQSGVSHYQSIPVSQYLKKNNTWTQCTLQYITTY